MCVVGFLVEAGCPEGRGNGLSDALGRQAAVDFLRSWNVTGTLSVDRAWGGESQGSSRGSVCRHPALPVGAFGRRTHDRGVAVRVEVKRGKGGHLILYYGARKTVVKDRRKEIGAGLLLSMIRQLGLERNDFR